MAHFLNTLPFDFARPEAAELLRLLVGAYPTEAQAQALMLDVGVDPADVPGNPIMRLYWRNIIRAARDQDDLRTLVDRVLKDKTKAATHDRLRALLATAPKVEAPEPRSSGDLALADAGWRATPAETEHHEKIMGSRSTLVNVSFFEGGLRVAPSVARLEMDFPTGTYLGTAFLIGRSRLLTCHHNMFTDGAKVLAVRVQFNFQNDLAGLPRQAVVFDGDVATIVADQNDDWAVIDLKTAPSSESFGALRLGATIPPKPDDRVCIIQHPGGLPKKIGFQNNTVTYVDDRIVQYLTDTMPGSSGSPVFNERWEVVALHHSGGDLPVPGTIRKAFRNEGINITRVRAALQAKGLLAAEGMAT